MKKEKKILITGADSYIGRHFQEYLSQWPQEYCVNTVSTLSDEWQEISFSAYDTVLHVAAIVHKKEKLYTYEEYMEVNCNLAARIASKAKNDGVEQFIFLSTMAVYQDIVSLDETFIIDKHALCNPKTYYGVSKLEAENRLRNLSDESFKLVVVRPPMVYGPGSTGNYSRLKALALKVPIFPRIRNYRSMIYIDNLCEFFKRMIDNGESGLFHPQNKEPVEVLDMVRCIREMHGKSLIESKVLAWCVRTFMKRNAAAIKVFGNRVASEGLSDYDDFEYCIVGFKDSIRLS